MTEEQPWVLEFQNYNGDWKHIGWYSSANGEHFPRYVTMEEGIAHLKNRQSHYPWRMEKRNHRRKYSCGAIRMMYPFEREWYLEFCTEHTQWRAMYSVSSSGYSAASNKEQYFQVSPNYWLSKIYLRGLHEIIRDLKQQEDAHPFVTDRHYRIVNHKTKEIIPGELFAD